MNENKQTFPSMHYIITSLNSLCIFDLFSVLKISRNCLFLTLVPINDYLMFSKKECKPTMQSKGGLISKETFTLVQFSK